MRNCGQSTNQDQQGNVTNVTTEKDGDQWQEISQSQNLQKQSLNWPLKVGWAGSVPGHGEQEGLGERAQLIRITVRSSVYLEHVRGKVVTEEAGKANRNPKPCNTCQRIWIISWGHWEIIKRFETRVIASDFQGLCLSVFLCLFGYSVQQAFERRKETRCDTPWEKCLGSSLVTEGIRERKGAFFVKLQSDDVILTLETLQTFPIILGIKFPKLLTWLIKGPFMFWMPLSALLCTDPLCSLYRLKYVKEFTHLLL